MDSEAAPDATQASTKDGAKAGKNDKADEAVPVELAEASSGAI